MNNIHIEEYLSNFAHFKGVYPLDLIPNNIPLHTGIIINTDKAKDPGQHWVAIYLNANQLAVYFDSFGLPPLHKEFTNFLDIISPKGWYYNSITFQNANENTCGLYCVYFLSNMLKGYSFNNFLSVFNCEKNDILAKMLYKIQQ